MPSLRVCLVLAGLASALGAQTVPSGWKAVVDKNGVCQMAVPPDWKANQFLPFQFEDPKGSSSAMLVNETNGSAGPWSDAVIQAFKPEKVVENSARRVFLIDRPTSFLNQTTRSWSVWAPAAKGNCHLTVALKKGADEDLLRKVVDTLSRK